MKKILFTKISGAGNDFIIVDQKLNPDLSLTEKQINKMCQRRTGIGADGLIEIFDSSDFNFEMKYYNSDGKIGSLCGNGSRSAIKYAFLSERTGMGDVKFSCDGKIYSGEVFRDGLVRFNLLEPTGLKRNFNLQDFDFINDMAFIDTGSPHVVINIKDINSNNFKGLRDLPVYSLGKSIRNAEELKPGGSNVNFIEIENNIINIRTFERGVEDETLACGTGSVASALISFLKYDLKPPVSLITASGEKLVVDFNYNNNIFSNISLKGPAEVIYKGEYLVKEED